MRQSAGGCERIPAGRWQAHTGGMKLLYVIADFFIATFGITQPTAKTRDQAAWFIAGLLVILVVAVTCVGLTVQHVMTAK